MRIEMHGDIQTTPDYWDCECSNYYIHKASVDHCIECDSYRGDSADSRVDEVESGENFADEGSDPC